MWTRLHKPILAGLFWKRATRAGAIAATLLGLVTSLSFGYIDKYVYKLPFHFSFIPFILAIITIFVVSLLTRKTSKNVIEETETGASF